MKITIFDDRKIPNYISPSTYFPTFSVAKQISNLMFDQQCQVFYNKQSTQSFPILGLIRPLTKPYQPSLRNSLPTPSPPNPSFLINRSFLRPSFIFSKHLHLFRKKNTIEQIKKYHRCTLPVVWLTV